jgi:transcriptional antiterminator Rof (Rho-off)
MPIDCNMYDVLLVKATVKKLCSIIFKSKEKTETLTATIVDVYTKAKEEFMQLSNGEIIRLNKIISVDEIIINSN